MADNVQVVVKPENQEEVMAGISRVIKTTIPLKPIIGTREDSPSMVFLVYEGVLNGQEIAATAMTCGASMATLM